MIEINLLPSTGKKKAASRQSVDLKAFGAGVTHRMRDGWMIGAIVSVVVAAAVIGGLYYTQGVKDAVLAERQANATHDSTQYAAFLKDRYASESARDALLRQVNIIKSLDEDRYVWPHVLDEVNRALPQYTWLTMISFTGNPQGEGKVVINPKTAADTSAAAKKANRPPKRMDTNVPKDVITIRLAGRTVDIQAMTRFWKDLEASPFFGNVNIDKSELALDQGKEVTQFQLTLGYTRPDTATIHRVPLAISVR